MTDEVDRERDRLHEEFHRLDALRFPLLKVAVGLRADRAVVVRAAEGHVKFHRVVAQLLQSQAVPHPFR